MVFKISDNTNIESQSVQQMYHLTVFSTEHNVRSPEVNDNVLNKILT